MYDFDTRAQFLGGPLDGRVEMLHGLPVVAHFDQWRGKVGNHVCVRLTYRRDETRFLDGDNVAYIYEGEEIRA